MAAKVRILQKFKKPVIVPVVAIKEQEEPVSWAASVETLKSEMIQKYDHLNELTKALDTKTQYIMQGIEMVTKATHENLELVSTKVSSTEDMMKHTRDTAITKMVNITQRVEAIETVTTSIDDWVHATVKELKVSVDSRLEKLDVENLEKFRKFGTQINKTVKKLMDAQCKCAEDIESRLKSRCERMEETLVMRSQSWLASKGG